MHDYFQLFQQHPILTPVKPQLTDEDVHDWLFWRLFGQPRERQRERHINKLIAAGQPVEAYLLAIENWQQEGSE